MLVGVDEVGRGAWAGPLAVGVATGEVAIAGGILKRRHSESYYDSKALSPRQRLVLFHELQGRGLVFGIGYAAAPEIDALGLTGALSLAAERGLVDLASKTSMSIDGDCLLLDGKHNYLRRTNVTMIVGGDYLHPLIAAASIAAKLARDALMISMDEELPYWDFVSSKGYGSKRHRFGLLWQGPSIEHRRSFRPVRELGVPVSAQFFHLPSGKVDSCCEDSRSG
ncbi:ribonuclease HII [Ferrimicrobium sp.]|uniref:ribonuclease HII n=1 Tax=Ferrimicrobium sp. TaxID=2926050 RepID=UPI0026201F74|nr:ribonuclease HII [Ferrimicrobium sp.]